MGRRSARVFFGIVVALMLVVEIPVAQATTFKPLLDGKGLDAASIETLGREGNLLVRLDVMAHQSEARRILDLVNAARAREGVSPLTWDVNLERAAEQRAGEIVYLFDHTRPCDLSCFTVFEDMGVTASYPVGENILMGASDAQTANYHWSNSSGHYANMVNAGFTGFAAAACQVGNTWYWVELFSGNSGTGFTTEPAEGLASVVFDVAPRYVYRLFPDVSEQDWFVRDPEDFAYAIAHGIMRGNANGTFAPYQPVTREQVAVILHRMAGEPVAWSEDFSDVDYQGYSGDAIRWARSVGVISGYGNNKFGPRDNVAREQLAIMLHNYAVKVAKIPTNTDESRAQRIAGWDNVDGYARPAMAFAVNEGIIGGVQGSQGVNLLPLGSADRASTTVMAARFMRDTLNR